MTNAKDTLLALTTGNATERNRAAKSLKQWENDSQKERFNVFADALEQEFSKAENDIYNAFCDLSTVEFYKSDPALAKESWPNAIGFARITAGVHCHFAFPPNILETVDNFNAVFTTCDPAKMVDFIRNPDNVQGIEKRERWTNEVYQLVNQLLPE